MTKRGKAKHGGRKRAAKPRALPKSLTDAFGLFKDKPIDPVRFQRKLRKEWEERLKRQYALGSRHLAK